MDSKYEDILNKFKTQLDEIELPTAAELELTKPVPAAEVKAAGDKLIAAAKESKQQWIKEGLEIFTTLAKLAMKSQTGGIA